MTVKIDDKKSLFADKSVDEKARQFAESYRLVPETQEEIDEFAEWEAEQCWEE